MYGIVGKVWWCEIIGGGVDFVYYIVSKFVF